MTYICIIKEEGTLIMNIKYVRTYALLLPIIRSSFKDSPSEKTVLMKACYITHDTNNTRIRRLKEAPFGPWFVRFATPPSSYKNHYGTILLLLLLSGSMSVVVEPYRTLRV